MKIWSTWKFTKLPSLFLFEAANWDLLNSSSFTLLHVVSTEGARTASTCRAQQPQWGDNRFLPSFREVIKPWIIQNAWVWVDYTAIWEVEEYLLLASMGKHRGSSKGIAASSLCFHNHLLFLARAASPDATSFIKRTLARFSEANIQFWYTRDSLPDSMCFLQCSLF